jgi:hypothetical protein
VWHPRLVNRESCIQHWQALRHDWNKIHLSKQNSHLKKRADPQHQQQTTQMNLNVQNMSPPKYYDNNVLTEESAAVAREKCISLIRQHLSNHLEENPNTSYESWIASCHPEM